jgi:hypothetical protein
MLGGMSVLQFRQTRKCKDAEVLQNRKTKVILIYRVRGELLIRQNKHIAKTCCLCLFWRINNCRPAPRSSTVLPLGGIAAAADGGNYFMK